MEWLLSTETMEVVKEKLGETLEIAINLSKQYKLVLIGTGAVVGLYWYATRTHGYFKERGIPGPKPGLLGAFSDYKNKGIADFDREVMKKYGKVVGIFHARCPVFLISDVDIIRQIMVKEFPTFVNRNDNPVPRDPVLRDSLVAASDDHWKFLRSVLSPTFTSGRLREMAPLIQKCVDTMLDNLWTISDGGKKSLKMREVFSTFTMDAIASTAFGVELDCQKDPDNPFIKHAKKVMNPGPKIYLIFTICSLFPFMIKVLEAIGVSTMDRSAGDFFTKAVHGAIEHRKEQNVTRKDFLQLMLNSHKLEVDREEEDPDTHLEFDKSKRRGMTNNEIVGNALLFLLAGYETTSLAMTFMAYNLATNSECQDKLIEEIDRVLNGKPPDYDNVSQLQYLENVFLETLRIFPAAVRISRIGNEDIEINGLLIPKGVEIHIPVLALHFDPDYWPEPEKFDPDRFLPENRPQDYNYVYLPFGAGPRNCIGMRLAHMEAKMAMAGILQKYRFKTAPETKIPPDLDKGQNKPKDGMILMIEKR